MITTPTIWFAITHPRGHVVIDGGNAPEVAVDAAKHWGAITEMSTPIMSPEEAVVPALRGQGSIPPTCAGSCRATCTRPHRRGRGIETSRNAQVLVTRREYDFAMAPEGYFATWATPAGLPQGRRRLGVPRGHRGRLRRVRRRRPALLVHARPLARPHVLRGAAAERPGACARVDAANTLDHLDERSSQVHARAMRPGARSSACAGSPGAPRRP